VVGQTLASALRIGIVLGTIQFAQSMGTASVPVTGLGKKLAGRTAAAAVVAVAVLVVVAGEGEGATKEAVDTKEVVVVIEEEEEQEIAPELMPVPQSR